MIEFFVMFFLGVGIGFYLAALLHVRGIVNLEQIIKKKE